MTDGDPGGPGDPPFPCPADAARGEAGEPIRERTCGEVFSSLNGAVSHGAMSAGPAHPDMSRREAADALGSEKAGGGGRPPAADPAETADAGPSGGGGDTAAAERREPDIPPADMEEGEETEDCPNCGADLGHSLPEIREFIETHGGARCEECDYRLRVVSDDE